MISFPQLSRLALVLALCFLMLLLIGSAITVRPPAAESCGPKAGAALQGPSPFSLPATTCATLAAKGN